jgi:hypothetical protein
MMSVPRILHRVFSIASHRVAGWRGRRGARQAHPPPDSPASSVERPTEHADERTIRRAAEEQLGGTSSADSRDAYVRGDNPGGLHRGGHGPTSRESENEDAHADPLGDTPTSPPPNRH